MKTDKLYRTMAMAALLAQLVVATQINTTSEDFENNIKVAHHINEDSSPAAHLDRSFGKNVHIFTKAADEYEVLRHSNHLPRTNRLRREAFSTSPPSTISETAAPEKDIKQANRIEIIAYLQSREFASVAQILDTCEDDAYESVVREIYERRAENFDMLRSFGDFSFNATRQVKFFRVLYKVMRANGRNDTKELTKLSQSIQNGILNGDIGVNIVSALSLLNHVRYDDLIGQIKSREFTPAERKLVDCTDDAYVFAVGEIYDQQRENFDLLLSFAESARDVEVKFKLYDAVHGTMKNSFQRDLAKLLLLYSSVKRELSSNLKNYDPSNFLFDELKTEILDQVVEPITSGFIENANLSKAQQLSGEIFYADFDLLFGVYDAVIKNITDKLTIAEILDKESYWVNRLIERIAVHEAITNQIQRIGHLANNETISLARHMKQVQNNLAYRVVVPQYWRSRYEESKTKLPLMVRNIVFSSRVCLRNIAYNEYLYASEDTLGEFRRHVYTVPLRNKKVTSIHRWTIQFISNLKVYFLNEEFGEYLHSDIDQFRYGKRYTFTHRTKKVYFDTPWDLDLAPDGKTVYLRGYYREYLFSDASKKNNREHYVFTYPIKYTKTENCKWEIVDCS